jgi:hypothetical protein
VFLRPLGGAWPDGTQQFAIVDQGQGAAAWNSLTVYGAGSHVIGSDGKAYVAKIANLTGVNPVGDAGVHWQPLW